LHKNGNKKERRKKQMYREIHHMIRSHILLLFLGEKLDMLTKDLVGLWCLMPLSTIFQL